MHLHIYVVIGKSRVSSHIAQYRMLLRVRQYDYHIQWVIFIAGRIRSQKRKPTYTVSNVLGREKASLRPKTYLLSN
jgi:hypothetical protein